MVTFGRRRYVVLQRNDCSQRAGCIKGNSRKLTSRLVQDLRGSSEPRHWIAPTSSGCVFGSVEPSGRRRVTTPNQRVTQYDIVIMFHGTILYKFDCLLIPIENQ